MNRSGFITGMIAFFVSAPLQADVVGFQIGSGIWQPDYSGSFALDGPTQGTVIDIERIGFDHESHNDLWLKLEHFIPIVPNFKLSSVGFDATVSTVLSNDIVYGGEMFSANIDTRFDMSSTELTFYYELLDNWINLDAGFTFRQFDGQSSISGTTSGTGTTVSVREDLDFIMPLFYLDARIDLPFTGFFVDSTMNTISTSDDVISDINVSLGYESEPGLGARLGYRTQELDFSESDFDADLEFKGTYLNLFYHF